MTALRRSEVRGRWGEVALRRLVESSGLLPHVHFEEQSSSRDDAGDLLRPDLIVHLADDRDIVVDAKVPLSAYLDAAETPDDATTRLLWRTLGQCDAWEAIPRLAGIPGALPEVLGTED